MTMTVVVIQNLIVIPILLALVALAVVVIREGL